jgi:hypothetical protein
VDGNTFDTLAKNVARSRRAVLGHVAGAVLAAAAGLVRAPGRARAGIITSDGGYLWPNGIIPYDDRKLEPYHQALARQAMNHWESLTPIRFVDMFDDPCPLYASGRARDWIAIVVPDADADLQCETDSLGRVPDRCGVHHGEHKVRVGPRCDVGNIIHELGHVVGLDHEHLRPDRDEWIDVHFDNIKPDARDYYRNTFQTENAGIFWYRDTYDFGSIMHYSEYSQNFAIDPSKPVMTALKPHPGVTIGQRNGLSEGDVLAVLRIYREQLLSRGTLERGTGGRCGGACCAENELCCLLRPGDTPSCVVAASVSSEGRCQAGSAVRLNPNPPPLKC